MNKNLKIYITGHNNLVGSAIHRKLEKEGYTNLLISNGSVQDLRNYVWVADFFQRERPDYVFLTSESLRKRLVNDAARSVDLYERLQVQSNIIHLSYLTGVKKLMLIASDCISSQLAHPPIKNICLLDSLFDETNEYAVAEIIGIKMCDAYRKRYDCNFISVLTASLYGYNDNYDLNNSHILPSLIRKFQDAKMKKNANMAIPGAAGALFEFLFADDMAKACKDLMINYNGTAPVFIGSGEDITMETLTQMIKDLIKYQGNIHFDETIPDIFLGKPMSISISLKKEWDHFIGLQNGIKLVYQDFLMIHYPEIFFQSDL
ncbi:NAD-dependent epimerase/dehydratase family protein [Mucilaginibacter sp. SP1R1]|uniref:NAD-dependent epimerase/dehydratase family protein n=1 Tax=Mucilaginibacter sp. SP1R1 TaxID=2723091 RepID=UPI00160FCDD6|nr:NAD-dependent epimerase/dehydratase family protein [Mucilaginibacter sp. SP1R1]MBB6148294.1 GDP-L-fucose synthase [Mucilaginibacter sp. SP1R1]